MDARYDEFFVLKWSVQPRIKNNIRLLTEYATKTGVTK